jgi:hypothetical protein
MAVEQGRQTNVQAQALARIGTAFPKPPSVTNMELNSSILNRNSNFDANLSANGSKKTGSSAWAIPEDQLNGENDEADDGSDSILKNNQKQTTSIRTPILTLNDKVRAVTIGRIRHIC